MGGVVEGGGGMQQKRILIGLELNAILSAHSGPPQYPEAKTKTVGMGCVCVCLEVSTIHRTSVKI